MQNLEDLRPGAANHRPLTPVDFLVRALAAYPNRPAVSWRDMTLTYAQFGAIVARFACALAERGVGKDDVVSILAPNRPEMLAAHYAVPMLGAVLNTINTRLDVDTITYILDHSESVLLVADETARDRAAEAAASAQHAVPVVVLAEPGESVDKESLDLLSPGQATALPDPLNGITDEWQPICLNYTSGTTGRPKGVVYHHRGAYLNALGNVLALKLDERSSYLWTLPMFHCNGWCHTWAVTAAGGMHVCLERVDPQLIYEAIGRHAVSHLSCAPVVLYMLVNHPGRQGRAGAPRLTAVTGGAAPTSALIEQLDAIGFDLIHLYGLTESFGPATLCILDEQQAGESVQEKARLLARQGLRHPTASVARVVDGDGTDVPPDGQSMGEIVLTGNTVMAGYYRDAEATRAAFSGGMFHTGDLAVVHPDGFIEIRDRSKDVIISGGENISSLEVEGVLHQHPGVMLAAVVAAPHSKWGEVPFAFIEPKPGAEMAGDELIEFCRGRLAGYKIPRNFAFIELPKTSTGKIQKFMLRETARRMVTGAADDA